MAALTRRDAPFGFAGDVEGDVELAARRRRTIRARGDAAHRAHRGVERRIGQRVDRDFNRLAGCDVRAILLGQLGGHLNAATCR